MISNLTKNIADFLNKPYGLLQDNRVKLLMIWSGLFTFFMVILLSPYELIVWSNIKLLWIILLACATGTIIAAVHLYIIQDLIFEKFTILTTIIWWIWIDIVIGFNNFILASIFRYNKVFMWRYMYNDILVALIIDIAPTIIILLIYHNYLLKKKIKTINEINSNLILYQNKLHSNKSLSFTSKNLAKVLTIDSSSLLYITSADNYIELCWKENGQIKKTLLRNTLTHVLDEINKQCDFITRCHHSYVVNLKQIDSLSGNSAGYKIILNGISFPIPVSRKYRDVFLEHLKE